mmetsp:Transcript_64800/g.146178  ORF Transcript_64800/g.146178 Transcript_64800/m.146178 type:complete len:215 (-) Transcript_64800:268-912(-)
MTFDVRAALPQRTNWGHGYAVLSKVSLWDMYFKLISALAFPPSCRTRTCGFFRTQASQFGAFMTAATLVFAMLGCLTRIRKVADTNWQKVLGCIPDTLGVITQAQALWLFADGCYSTFPDENEEGHKITYLGGPGYWAYVFCWLAAIVRVTMHYMTPVPGGGAGCHLVDLKKGFVELEKDAEAAAKEVGRSMSKTKDPVSKQPDPEPPKNSGLT